MLVLFSLTAFAQTGWRAADGTPASNSDARKSVNGFGGWLVITSDADWLAKWKTPPKTIPRFNGVKAVAHGNKIFGLILFSNPLPDADGNADVTCDLEVVKPDGSSAYQQTDAACFKGKLKGNRYNVHLAAPVIGFVGDPGDPSGKWQIRVVLKDDNRNVELPLKATFVLQ